MEEILSRAKSLGIEFDEEMDEKLDLLSELQELLHDAERQRTYLIGEGDETALHDKVIAKRREEIRDLLSKFR